MEKAIRRYWPIFVLPTFLAFILGFIAPFVMGVYLSFCKFTTVTDAKFIGFSNYLKIFTDASFVHALWYTAIFTVVTVVLINVLAFAVALLLTKGFRGTNIFRTVFFMPNLIGGIILGYIWQLLLNGVLLYMNRTLTYSSVYGFWGLVILMCWQQIGYMMIIYIAGIQNIPGDLIEAAKIDGATSGQILKNVTIPMVMPSITICTFLTLTNSFKLFDQNLALTNGEPSNMSELLALNIFRTFYGRTGWEGVGQAKAVVFFLLVAAIALTQNWLTGTAVMNVRKAKHGWIFTLVFTLISIAYVFPIALVVINSFKKKAYISKKPFAIPTDKMFVGIENYIKGIQRTGFIDAFFTSLFITVLSVGVIILCTSMCAWYISRVKNRFTTALYFLCLFSMIVPFQMVMFTLSKLADMLKLNNPLGIVIVYLGFGAGLSVFMFCGFVKSIPLEIEEAAMIDGCTPLQTFFGIVMPIMKPTCITVAILQTMWIWNDYLLPYLVLDMTKYKTVPIAVQYLKGGYGSVDMGAMMGVLVLAIIPIIVFYLACQKYIIEGVVAGAVKG